MLEIEKWINLRQQEQDFQYANGFNNGDPKTNGEYLCTDYFMNLGIDTFCDIGTNVGIFSKRILENTLKFLFIPLNLTPNTLRS